MKIAIGSTNEDKISGIQLGLDSLKSGDIVKNINSYQEQIWEIIKNEFGKNITLKTYKTKSGVKDMPTSEEETCIGARNRAMDLIESGIDADYYIGTEGGINKILDTTVLFSVVYIISNFGTIHMGISNSIELTRSLAKKVNDGIDLSEAFKKQHGTITNGSVSGELSLGEYARKKQFEIAFKSAMLPFCNSKYYK